MIPDINLLPKRERRSASGGWLFIIFGVVFIIVFGLIIVQYILLTKSTTVLEAEQAALISENEALEEELLALSEPVGADLETSVQFIEGISYPVSPLIVELKRYLDEHAYLRNYSFREDTLSFSVDFETLTDVSDYMEDLLGSPYVKDVIVNGMSTFDPASREEDNPFNVIDRFANTFEVLIDLDYLREVDGEG